jgi:hypothetical protein
MFNITVREASRFGPLQPARRAGRRIINPLRLPPSARRRVVAALTGEDGVKCGGPGERRPRVLGLLGRRLPPT